MLRFVSGIDVTPTFTGTISDLPFYYVNKLQVQLSGSGVSQPMMVDIQSTGATQGAKFTFTYDAANLPAGNTSVLLLFPGPQGLAAPPGTTAPVLYTIPVPGWMGTPTRAVLDRARRSPRRLRRGRLNAIDIQFGKVSSSDLLPLTDNTPDFLGTLFNNFSGSVGTGLQLTVYATLEPTPGQAKLELSNWTVQTSILNNPLFDQAKSLLTQAGVSASVDLTPKTLDPARIVVSATNLELASLPHTFFSLPFGGSKSFRPRPHRDLPRRRDHRRRETGASGDVRREPRLHTGQRPDHDQPGRRPATFDPTHSSVVAAKGPRHAQLQGHGVDRGRDGPVFIPPGCPQRDRGGRGEHQGVVSAAVNARLQLDLAAPC